jgi:hypothetical protein
MSNISSESLEMEKARMLRNLKKMEHKQIVIDADNEILNDICEFENLYYENDILQTLNDALEIRNDVLERQNDIIQRRNNLLTFNLSNLYYKTSNAINQGYVPIATITPDGFLVIMQNNVH